MAWSFFDVFLHQVIFLITNMCVATEEFFGYVVLLLLIGLGLNILVLFPSLII